MKTIAKQPPTMASALKQHFQSINSVAAIDKYLPRCCGITIFTTDFNEGQSVQAGDMNIWAAAMSDKPKMHLSA